MSKDHPLGLPEGSVRAILAIGITIGAFVLFMFKKGFEVSSFLSLVGLPIGLYFGQYISPAGGGAAGQVAAAVGDTLAGVGGVLTPVTDTLQHTVTHLAQVADGAAPPVGGGELVVVTDAVAGATRTVGGIVSGVVAARRSNGAVFGS